MTELIIVTVAKGGHSLDVTIRDHGYADRDIDAGRWELVSVKLGTFDLTSLLDDSAVLDDIFEEAINAVADDLAPSGGMSEQDRAYAGMDPKFNAALKAAWGNL